MIVSSAGLVWKRVSGVPKPAARLGVPHELSGSGVRERGMKGRSTGSESDRALVCDGGVMDALAGTASSLLRRSGSETDKRSTRDD